MDAKEHEFLKKPATGDLAADVTPKVSGGQRRT